MPEEQVKAKGAGHSRHGQLGQLATGGTGWLWLSATLGDSSR